MHHARLHDPRQRPPRRALRTAVAAAVASSLLFAACSGDDAPEAASSAPASSASVTEPDATPAPATAAPVDTQAPTTDPAVTEPADTSVADTVPATEPATGDTTPLDPLDDLDEDGTRDETCGTVDLGGGLVVNTLCDTALVPTPEEGVVPTAGSLLLLPAPTRWDDLADVDATVRVAGTPDGGRVIIYVLGSDTLFDSGSATVRSTATPPLDAIVASIGTRFPDATIEVRGAADSVGEPAANQALSEQRAASVAAELTARGVPGDRVTSIGLGELVPVAEETTPDGGVSDIGRQVNRRVEIVVRVTA